MISIQGKRFDVSELQGEYKDGGVERHVLAVMGAGLSVHGYGNRRQLEFELELRSAVVGAARALNDSGLGFVDFHNTRCNASYWKRTENGGFLLKEGARPGRAVSDIYANGGAYATECATAVQIVYYKALLEVYGESLFDRLFPEIYLMNWDITEPLLRGLGVPEREADILDGDRGYFVNEDVDPRTPEWRGENVIALPDSLYYGHGIGIGTVEDIIGELNGRRKKDAERPAHLLDRVGRPDFRRLAEARGGAVTEAGAYPVEQKAPPASGPLVWRPFPAPVTQPPARRSLPRS